MIGKTIDNVGSTTAFRLHAPNERRVPSVSQQEKLEPPAVEL